jgi:hypothetical protein
MSKKAKETKNTKNTKETKTTPEIKDPRILALITLVTTYIACLIVWPLMDLFWCNVVSHSEFVFNPAVYFLEPIAFAVIVTIIFNIKPIIKFYKARKTKK